MFNVESFVLGFTCGVLFGSIIVGIVAFKAIRSLKLFAEHMKKGEK